MTWDPEKYREKREKVFGVRKRGISFTVILVVASCVILGGMASLGLPGAISYMRTRHLDDAIFRLEGNQTWPNGLIVALGQMEGVAAASLDTHNTRLVVTFDRRLSQPQVFVTLFGKHGLKSTLLNRVGHRHHMTTLENEKEAQGEAS